MMFIFLKKAKIKRIEPASDHFLNTSSATATEQLDCEELFLSAADANGIRGGAG